MILSLKWEAKRRAAKALGRNNATCANWRMLNILKPRVKMDESEGI